jgi:hypothetical protein
MLRNERRCDHTAFQLLASKMPSQNKAAGTRFIANPKLTFWMAQLLESLVHHVEVVRDFSAKRDAPIPTCFGDRDGNRIAVDIESDVV